MSRLKTLLIPLAALICASSMSGCYTQVASRHTDSIVSRPRGGNCDSGDCRDVAPSSDRREICVWERDFLGFPEMRCYNTNYYSSWVYFHNTPWWYRDRYGWRDTRGCPPYYYYDRIAGICRHHSYASGGGGGGGGTSSGQGQEHLVERRNSRGLNPTPAPAAESGASVSSPMFIGGGTRPLSPVGSSVTSSTSTSTSASTSAHPSQSQTKQTTESTSSATSTPSSEQTSGPSVSTPPPPPPPTQEQSPQPVRRNARGL